MPLNEQDVDRIAELAALAPSAREAVQSVRTAFPGVTVTRVDAMDMRGENPVRRLPGRDLFLVDARSHCWSVTADPAAATGVVIAD